MFLIAVASIVALGAEVALRAVAYVEDVRVERALASLDGRALDPDLRSDQVPLGALIRLSEHDRIIYELKPNLRLAYENAELTTSPEGFRSPSLPEAKPRGTVRIVGLGDSNMFGWRVGDDEGFLRRLEVRLNERPGAVRWEALNTAVPGYNTAMEVETLRRRALAYAPDLVVVHYVGNDVALPNFIRTRARVLALDRSFLLDRLLQRARPAAGLAPTPHGDDGFTSAPERVPPEYADMVGVPGVVDALGALAALRREHGFEVVFLYDVAPDELLDAARAGGFHLVRPDPADVDRHLARLADEGRDVGGSLTISAADPHPSALGHAVLAEMLFEALEVAGLLAELEGDVAGHGG